MIFADLFFLYFFLPLCLIAYFICHFFVKKMAAKNIVLIVFSLVFYAWGEPLYVILLLFSAAFNWFMGLMIGHNRSVEKKAKLCVGIAVGVDILLLMIFKYSGFFVENFNGLFHASIPVPQITLPIGISFFTFQAISYIIDCYWETVKPQKHFLNFLLYLSLFPQLIAGPIVRYSVVEKEINKRKSTVSDISEGGMRFVVGLAKKVIIANNLYAIVKQFYGDVNAGQFNDISGMSFLGTWFVIIAYSLYVYFDFSGYSDMAIGLGRIFGFHFDENFKYPFICKTISEFWQRWHISLSTFFRDYLFYVPIFGKPRKYLNLFLVWFCTGMWHGASWNFIFWGLYYGLFLLLEIKLGKKRMKKWPVWLSHLYSKFVIVLGFGIFCFADMKQLGNFFLNAFGISMVTNGNAFADQITWSAFVGNIFLMIAAVLCSLPILPKIKHFFFEFGNNVVYTTGKVLGAVGCAYLLVMCSILLVDTTNNPFLYFRF